MSPLFESRNQCPVCESTDCTEVYRKPYSSDVLKKYLQNFYSKQGNYDYSKVKDADYALAKCNSCTCVFQVEIPNDALMNELYEVWLDPDQTFEIFEMNYPLDYYVVHMKKIYRYLRLINKKPKKITVLDFGMGWGNWLQIAKAFGCNVYGCELSPKRIAYAESNGISNLDFNNIGDRKFDFINTDQVFEHVPNPRTILQKLIRSLNSDGYIRICVPDGSNIQKLLTILDWDALKGSANSLNVIAPLEHINCFTTTSILKMGSDLGLEPVYVPDYPRIDEKITPLEKGEKLSLIKSSTISLIKDIIRPVYSKLKKSNAEEISFRGSDILFRFKKQ